MDRILVATDGSNAAGEAVSWAADLAGAVGAEVVVATVVEPDGSADGPEHDGDERHREASRRLEEDWVAPLVEAGIDPRLTVLEGDPRAALSKVVEDDGIDAVVVGTRGSGGFRGLGLGGVAHYLAHHLPCALIAVPRAGGPLAGGTVVVGADGSAANESALCWGARVADELRGRAVAVHVHAAQADVMTHTQPTWKYRREPEVRAAAERAGVGTVAVDIELAAGNPVEEIVRVGREVDAGLLVVGRRGWGSLHGMVLGRVPAQLLHHADRPVAVVSR